MSLSEEETDYLRLAILVIKVAPQAVRYLFDQRFPPSNLENILKTNSGKLNSLQSSKIVNAAQAALLFPSSGSTSSTTYDVTLLICLLRNVVPNGLYKIQKPHNGFDKLPAYTDKSEGADLARIKHYRNHIAHHTNGKIPKADFNMAWADLCGAISRLGVGRYDQDCRDLRVASLDGSDKEVYREVLKTQSELENLRKELERIRKITVPLNVQERMNRKIELWEDKETKFAETSASLALKTMVDEGHCFLITGNSGSGKSSNCYHIALYLRSKGYNILPIMRPKELLDYSSTDLQQVFIINDVCGKYYADKGLIQEWLSYEDDIKLLLENSDLKLLMNSRLIVSQDEHFEMMSFLDYSEINLKSPSYFLTLAERKAILKKHLGQGSEEGNDDNALLVSDDNLPPVSDQALESQDCFPLLCELFGENNLHSDPEKFFSEPFEEYKKDLDKLKLMNPHKYCTLALLVIFEDTIELADLSDLEVSPEISTKIDHVCTSVGLPKGTARQKLLEELGSLKNIYVTFENGRFKSLHDKMFDFLSSKIGPSLCECLLQYCSMKFIRERVRWCQPVYNYDEFVIILPEAAERSFFRRLMSELKKGRFSELILNRQAREVFFQEALIRQFGMMEKTELKNLVFNVPGDLENRAFITGQSLSEIKKILFTDGGKLVYKFLGRNEEVACFQLAYLSRLLNLNDIILFHFILVGGLNIVFKYIEEQFEDSVKSQILTRYNLCAALALAEGRTEIFSEILSKYGLGDHSINDETDKNYYPIFLESCYTGKLEVVKFLHENNLVYPEKTGCGESALWLACHAGQMKTLEFLISKKFDVNDANMYGISPLFVAVQKGHMNIAALLLENHADANLCVLDGRSPLFEACKIGNLEIVKLLLNWKANPNSIFTAKPIDQLFNLPLLKQLSEESTNRGLTPLFAASERGLTDICEILLQHGADTEIQEESGKTPLIAAIQHCHLEVVKLLLNHKANCNVTTGSGLTPLTMASQSGNIELVKVLIHSGASVDIIKNKNVKSIESSKGMHSICVKNLNGDEIGIIYPPNPLTIAAKNNHLEVLKFLVEQGMDVNLPGVQGATALFEASESGHTEIVEFLLGCSFIDINKATFENRTPLYISVSRKLCHIAEILLEAGADPNMCRKDGVSPLLKAVISSQSDVVKLLSRFQADPDLQSNDGLSPLLHAAASHKSCDILASLLDSGANVDIENRCKQTPLFLAVHNNRTASIHCLLSRGASLSVCDSNGDTLLLAALKSESVDKNIVEYLLEKGIDVNLCNNNGTSPLLCATHQGNLDIVRLLIGHGANVDQAYSHKPHPLIVAIENGYNDIAETLLRHDAVVDVLDDKQETALWKAVSSGNLAATKLLLEHGAQFDLKVRGKTPCELAVELNHIVIVNLLKSKEGYVQRFLGLVNWVIPLLRDRF